MVSVATKISMFTMFSTMSLAATQGAGQTLTEVLADLAKQIDDLGDVQYAHQVRVNAVEATLLDIEDKQITGDFFYTNDSPIVFEVAGEYALAKHLFTFEVASGEVLDFIANVTSNHDDNGGNNNMLSLYLVKDGLRVSNAVDDGNGGDDNASLSLLYKEKMTQMSTFHVWSQAFTEDISIQPNFLQIGYKTYGSGHSVSPIY